MFSEKLKIKLFIKKKLRPKGKKQNFFQQFPKTRLGLSKSSET